MGGDTFSSVDGSGLTRSPDQEPRTRVEVPRHSPLDERVLLTEVNAVLERAQALLGISADEFSSDAEAADHLDDRVSLALSEAAQRLTRPDEPCVAGSALVELLVELHEVQGRLRERRLARRLQAVARVQESLARLRSVGNPSDLLDRAPREVCHSVGLERAVLSRVNGSEWVMESAYFEGHDEWATSWIQEAREHAPALLNHMVLETEMVRRRAPAIVFDAQSDPRTYKPLVASVQTRNYVSAPVMPEDRVIGFLHGDHHFSGRPVDTFDRDLLWLFAEGFGHVYERAVLLERLGSQRQEFQRMVTSTEAVIADLCNAEIQLDRATGESGAAVTRTAAAIFAIPRSAAESLLTRREIEVLSLMASGGTNAAIAQKLTISEGTVKSHVKHILRKLHASNRAEAVSRYARLSSLGLRDDSGEGV